MTLRAILLSLNLVKFLDEAGHFDARRFADACRIWTFTLEISVLMAQFPSRSSRRSHTISERSDSAMRTSARC